MSIPIRYELPTQRFPGQADCHFFGIRRVFPRLWPWPGMAGIMGPEGAKKEGAKKEDSSLNTTEPTVVRARAPRRKYPPHPPFGHLLPAGEKGTAITSAEGEDRRGGNQRSPSPRRGEGRGEGVRAVALSEESQNIPGTRGDLG